MVKLTLILIVSTIFLAAVYVLSPLEVYARDQPHFPTYRCNDLPDTDSYEKRKDCCLIIYQYDEEIGDYRDVGYCTMCETNKDTGERQCSGPDKVRELLKSENSNIDNGAGLLQDEDTNSSNKDMNTGNNAGVLIDRDSSGKTNQTNNISSYIIKDKE